MRGGIRIARVHAGAPYAMHLLCGIDEQEEQGESASRNGAVRQRERLDSLEQLLEGRRFGVSAATGARVAPQRFHMLKGLLTLETPDHTPERRRETTHVIVEGKVFGTGGTLGRLQ